MGCEDEVGVGCEDEQMQRHVCVDRCKVMLHLCVDRCNDMGCQDRCKDVFAGVKTSRCKDMCAYFVCVRMCV